MFACFDSTNNHVRTISDVDTIFFSFFWFLFFFSTSHRKHVSYCLGAPLSFTRGVTISGEIRRPERIERSNGSNLLGCCRFENCNASRGRPSATEQTFFRATRRKKEEQRPLSVFLPASTRSVYTCVITRILFLTPSVGFLERDKSAISKSNLRARFVTPPLSKKSPSHSADQQYAKLENQ